MKQLFYLFIIVIGLASCKDVTDLQGLEVSGNDAEFAIPLINSKVSFNDLLENFDQNTFVEIRDDGLVVLRYKGELMIMAFLMYGMMLFWKMAQRIL